MRLFGMELTVRKAASSVLSPVYEGRGWTTIFSNDRPPGAFQKDIHCDPSRVQSNWAVFACMTLIAGDMGKMRVQLVDTNEDGIYKAVNNPAFSPLLRKPNGYQTWQKFIESWIFSKLSKGNTYIHKERDNRNVVVAMHVLDPDRTTPLIAPDGSVFYRIGQDALAEVTQDIDAVPASEIIHDRMWCLFHPLVGLSPIFASGLAAINGIEIQSQSLDFFRNASRPSGVLTAPGTITDDTAKRLKETWDTRAPGTTAIAGDGLKYEAMTQSAADSQLVEQLKFSAEMICSTFHVPGYKVGIGAMPAYQNAEILNQIYYDDCLQTLIECVENTLDDGLGLLDKTLSIRLNTDDLLRMDSAAQIVALKEGVAASIMSPNEARAKLNLDAATGGDSPMIQQQNYSLEAISKRDAAADPFKTNAPAPPAPQPAPTAPTAEDQAAAKAVFAAQVRRALEIA